MARRLLLVRHADTGLTGRLVGATDVKAEARGLEEAGRLRALLRDHRPESVFVSPLSRARETLKRLGVSGHQIDPRLAEIDFGAWEMLDYKEISAKFPAETAAWSRAGDDFRFPGGESLGEFRERVSAMVVTLCAEPVDSVLAVTHGGVIRVMICALLGLEAKNSLLFDVRPGRLTLIDLFDQGGILAGLNL
jgi:broad specificity phosphatase PhoE